jgi:tryptophanyl-tRNA synthetase
MIILSGVRPTGHLQLGNYLGAIKQWVQMQNDTKKEQTSLFCIVDLHALTTTTQNIAEDTKTIAAAYIACGIDPKRSSIFVQSHVPEHTELSWLLSCFTPMGWLNRMTQFKEKAGKHRDQANLGLYAYPVLMAADILIYGATHVPVGEDQKQHLELARDIAQLINHRYEKELFTLPEPLILKTHAARVMSLRDGTKKMSKSDTSDYSRIHLTDDADTIALKIRKAKTDPHMLPATEQDLEGRPEARNLLTLYCELSGKTLEEGLMEFEGKPFSPLKQALSEVLIERIVPIGDIMKRLLQDDAYLATILKEGGQQARERAQNTLKGLKSALDFYPSSL